MMQSIRQFGVVLALAGCTVVSAAQTPAPRAAGTVKATDGNGVTVTTAAGQDVAVALPAAAKVLLVAPGSKDLKSATPGALSDVAVGDRVLVTGTEGDTATALNATRVIVMKATAIAQSHAAEDAAWAKGSGGIVKSVDAASGTITLASGLKTLTVTTTPATVVRRYSGDSVRFADATMSSIAAVKPGDQLRVRGNKSADGLTISADEMVAGSFKNYSGLLTAVDATAGTVTLKDLATKKVVVVSVTANSDLRRIPPQAAQMIAMRMKGGAAPAGAPGAGAAPANAGGPGAGAAAGSRRAGADLSQMLSRLPTETVAGLKTGDAVMIVATSPAADSTRSTAVTLLAGVDAILSASPEGTTTTLSPWSLGGGAEGGGEGGGGPQ
jgi:Cu/Ag efflux protein CusF